MYVFIASIVLSKGNVEGQVISVATRAMDLDFNRTGWLERSPGGHHTAENGSSVEKGSEMVILTYEGSMRAM